MTRQEEAEQFVKKAPPLNQTERDAINALFPTYIFRRSKTNEVWTSCCHRHETLPLRNKTLLVGFLRQTGTYGMTPIPREAWTDEEYTVITAPHQREPRSSYQPAPKENVVCPFCGRLAIVKELRYTGKRDNLTCWRRAVVLRWYRGALWATAYDCGKHYNDGYSLTDEPACNLVGVYRFKPGLAEATKRYYWDYPFQSIDRQSGPLTKGRWNISGPFHANFEHGVGYSVIGLDEIQKSPFRYCMAAEAKKATDKFLQFLTACCFYPRQIEMLMKADMRDVVLDLTERGVKHAAVINWDEENPAKAFSLNRQEMKIFLDTSRDIRIMELYKKLKGRVPLTECADWITKDVNIKSTFRAAKKWNLAPERLMRYLAGFVGCARYGGLSGLNDALQVWMDYLTAAEPLGYQLHRENVLLPKNLGAAHDSATAKHRGKMERERKKAQAEKDRLAALAYEERRVELEKKYGFAMDGYVIQVPGSKGAILDEGRKLQHCVGGYADRHMRGDVTILFMRQEKKLGVPWLTIEMSGNRLVQIHGFKNEGKYSVKGRFAPDPTEVYKDFLDTWLDWLKKGSKRDKDGNPKLPRKKGAAA